MSSVFLDALALKPTPRRPVWLMRQAGRYLPEYRALRAKAGSFLKLSQNPEWAAAITLQPLARFDLDAAIIFKDILTLPDAMGCRLTFVSGEGPAFERPITDAQSIRDLPMPDPMKDLAFVMEAMALVKKEKPGLPLIGFAGSPWTVAAYMVGEGRQDDFASIQTMRQKAPDVLHLLLDHLAQSTIQYLLAQVDAGADVLMLFDSWAGLLGDAFAEFSGRYLEVIVHGVKDQCPGVPIIVFCRQFRGDWQTLASMGCDALGVDQGMDLQNIREQVGGKVALQGNLEPSVLAGPPEKIAPAVHAVLDAYGAGPGHVFNLGHGITPDVPPEHVAIMIDAVHAHRFTHKEVA